MSSYDSPISGDKLFSKQIDSYNTLFGTNKTYKDALELYKGTDFQVINNKLRHPTMSIFRRKQITEEKLIKSIELIREMFKNIEPYRSIQGHLFYRIIPTVYLDKIIKKQYFIDKAFVSTSLEKGKYFAFSKKHGEYITNLHFHTLPGINYSVIPIDYVLHDKNYIEKHSEKEILFNEGSVYHFIGEYKDTREFISDNTIQYEFILLPNEKVYNSVVKDSNKYNEIKKHLLKLIKNLQDLELIFCFETYSNNIFNELFYLIQKHTTNVVTDVNECIIEFEKEIKLVINSLYSIEIYSKNLINNLNERKNINTVRNLLENKKSFIYKLFDKKTINVIVQKEYLTSRLDNINIDNSITGKEHFLKQAFIEELFKLFDKKYFLETRLVYLGWFKYLIEQNLLEIKEFESLLNQSQLKQLYKNTLVELNNL